MATKYYNAVLSMVDSNGDIHTIYPKTKASNVIMSDGSSIESVISELGTAAKKNFITFASSGSSDLITSGGVYTAIHNISKKYAGYTENYVTKSCNCDRNYSSSLIYADSSSQYNYDIIYLINIMTSLYYTTLGGETLHIAQLQSGSNLSYYLPYNSSYRRYSDQSGYYLKGLKTIEVIPSPSDISNVVNGGTNLISEHRIDENVTFFSRNHIDYMSGILCCIYWPDDIGSLGVPSTRELTARVIALKFRC